MFEKFVNDVRVGGMVFWDVSGTDFAWHIVEAKIVAIDGDTLKVTRRFKWHLVDGKLQRSAVSPFEEEEIEQPRSYFEVPLEEHLRETKQFWKDLAAPRDLAT